MLRFKVGDQVRWIASDHWSRPAGIIGPTGIVKSVTIVGDGRVFAETLLYSVEFSFGLYTLLGGYLALDSSVTRDETNQKA